MLRQVNQMILSQLCISQLGSYPRSIYRYHGITKKGFLALEFLSLNKIGDLSCSGNEEEYLKVPLKYSNDYRLATRQELIDEGVILRSVDFIINK